ncbi:DUF4405 domain-containing protein [Treponema sp. R8-4-B8]
MAIKQPIRITLDISMIALLLCAYNPRLARDTVHILIGITIFILFATHIFINRHWFINIFNGAYTPRRMLMTTFNLLLAIAAATLIITGLLEAVWSPSFLLFESGVTLREVHTAAAYWLMPFVGVHLGFHWGIFSKYIGKNRLVITLMRIFTTLFFMFGVWSFFDRDMFAKLFLGFSFDYWPQEKPIILFYIQTLSIIGIYVIITYYILKLIFWLKNRKTTNGGSL